MMHEHDEEDVGGVASSEVSSEDVRADMAGPVRFDGDTMYGWATDLYPLHRSLTGPGVRATLDYLGVRLPGLRRHLVASGTSAFDWIVPDEWTCRRAYVEDEHGERLIDSAWHNLHVVGYSVPIDAWMSVAELDRHLHSLPEQPTWVPFVTSYYQRRWGFCLSHEQRERLRRESGRRVHVVVDATLAPGFLDFADLLVPGESEGEVLFSTYVCHPSMANNELSGPVVQTALAQWLRSLPSRRLTYRFVFVPETIGSLVYLSEHLEHMQRHTHAGFALTCFGDERAYSYLASRRGDTLADRVARHVLQHRVGGHHSYSFLDRGSDERQYCAPGIDLPVCSLMRTKHGSFPEYHTSADDLSIISPGGLAGSLGLCRAIVTVLEKNLRFRTTTLGEPQLGRRGLYTSIGSGEIDAASSRYRDVLAYADGSLDLIGLADALGAYAVDLLPAIATLREHGLIVAEP